MTDTPKPSKLGQLLLKKRLVSDAQLADAMQEQASSNRFLGTILLERQWVTADQLLAALSEQYHMPSSRLRDGDVEPKVTEVVPLKIAMHYQVMPLQLRNSTLRVAIANPQDVQLTDDLRAALQERYVIEPVLATEADIGRAIPGFMRCAGDTGGVRCEHARHPFTGARMASIRVTREGITAA